MSPCPQRAKEPDGEERSRAMQIGMIGLGRMGANIARRLMRAWSRLRGLRPRSGAGGAQLAGEGACRRKPCRAGDGACRAARGLDHAARRRGDGSGDRRVERPARRPATPSSTAATRFWKDDIRRARELHGKGPPLPRRRHLRRRVGARARLLPDDRRREGRGGAARSDLCRAGAGQRRHPRNRRPRRARSRAPSRAICTPARTAPGTSSK